MKLNNFKKELICWGGGDQSIVIRPIIQSLGADFNIIVDDTPNLKSPFPDIEILAGRVAFEKWLIGKNPSNIGFVIAIGNPYGFIRCQIHSYLMAKGLSPITFCDPSALIDANVIIGDGVQIMKGVILNSLARIGDQCILNTKSLIEHHDFLEQGIEIAPGAILCGRVTIKKNTWIGAGAIILPRISIGSNSIIGAGSVVTKNIPDGQVYIGAPAKFLKNNQFMEGV